MNPPWAQYPDMPWLDIGWRMGAGEDYWSAFWDWYVALSVNERQSFKDQNPEPDGWWGFYAFVESDGNLMPPDFLEPE